MKMRRAVARALAPRVTAEGDRLALFVATVGVAAVAGREVNERKVTRRGFDASELCRLRSLEIGRRLQEFGNMARFVPPRCFCLRFCFWGPPGQVLGPLVGPGGTDEPHAPGAADRGTAGIVGPEPC